MATPDNKNQAGTEMPVTPGPNLQKGENLGEATRSKAQYVLAAGPNIPSPNEPEAKKPPTREQLIDQLGLRDQYENRADHMVHLINQDIFKLGKPIPTLEAALNSFSIEQLQFATTLQEPTLLLVPETSFAAKVNALNATKTMHMDKKRKDRRQQDCYVHVTYRGLDTGSEMITGWKALVVDGARKVMAKDGDNTKLSLVDRIRNRKATRKPGENGMDRHIYAMLMLEALRKGEPIDHRYVSTLLDDDPPSTDGTVPSARWWSGKCVHFHETTLYYQRPNAFSPHHYRRDGTSFFRSSVGGDVKL